MEAQAKFRPFELDDMLKINLRDFDLRTGTDGDRGVRAMVAMAERGEVLTLEIADEILMIAGLNLLFPGVAEMWSLTSIVVDRFPIAFHKKSLEVLDYWINANRLHRIQCYVYAEHEQSIKWIEALGFKAEGLMEKYDAQGRDHFMYARVKLWDR